MTPRIVVTDTDVLSEIVKASAAPDDARTTTEIVEATGLGRDRVKKELSHLHRAGRLLVHRVVRQAIDGRAQIVPAYTVTPKPKAKK